MGTMCYVMGGGELRSMAEMLPPGLRERLEIVFSPCLGYCDKAPAGAAPPYVELNGRLISRVSPANLMQIIKEELRDALR